MSEIHAPIEAYYAGEAARLPVILPGTTAYLEVTPRPFAESTATEEVILDRARAAKWAVLEADTPQGRRQFEALVFNAEDTEHTATIVAPTAGGYNDGHLVEGAQWAAQRGGKGPLVYLAELSLTKKELIHYARTGNLTHNENGKREALPSMQALARALQAAGIETADFLGTSAGIKQAVLAMDMDIPHVILSAPPQLTEQSVGSLAERAVIREGKQREQEAKAGQHDLDTFQVSDEWKSKIATAREGLPGRPTAHHLGSTLKNYATRGAHAFALSKGPQVLVNDLEAVIKKSPEVALSMVISQQDALYAATPEQLNKKVTEIVSYLGALSTGEQPRAVFVPSNHRFTQYYPTMMRGIADTLLETR